MSDQAVETLFLSTIPGATPSKWLHRYAARGSAVQLVTQDEQSQTLFLQPHDPPRYLPQLGYLRWRADQTWQELVTEAGLDPAEIHLVRLYDEAPVVMVSKEHLLAAWTEDDGDVGADELADETFWNPADYASAPVTDPLDAPEEVAAGERMAIKLAATGAVMSAPAPKPMTAMPVARPRRSGNHLTSVEIGAIYPTPRPIPLMNPYVSRNSTSESI